MKKLIVVLGLLVLPLVSKASTQVYTFMNGQGFDPSYSTTVPRYAFLGDGSGWDYELNQATTLMAVLGIAGTSTPTTVTVTTDLPTPTPTPIPTPTLVSLQPSVGDIAPVEAADGQVTCTNTFVNFYGNEVVCSNTNSELSAYFTTLTESNDYGHITAPTQDYQLTDVLSPRTSNFQIRPNTHDNIGAGVSISYILKDQSGQTVGDETTITLAN